MLKEWDVLREQVSLHQTSMWKTQEGSFQWAGGMKLLNRFIWPQEADLSGFLNVFCMWNNLWLPYPVFHLQPEVSAACGLPLLKTWVNRLACPFCHGPNGIFKTWQVNGLPERSSIWCLISLTSCGSSSEPLGGTNLSCSWGGGSVDAAEGVLWTKCFVVVITGATGQGLLAWCAASGSSSLADEHDRFCYLAPVLLLGAAGGQCKQWERGPCAPCSQCPTANLDSS